MIAAVGLLLFGASFPLFSDPRVFMIALIPCAFLTSLLLGTAPACIQDVTPSPMRAQLAALYTGVLNIIGLGFGPLAVGLLTDYAFEDPMKVGYSLSIVIAVGGFTSIIIYFRGLTPYLQTQKKLSGNYQDAH